MLQRALPEEPGAGEMDQITLLRRKVTLNEWITGLGGAFLVHVLVFSAALIAVWTTPHKPLKPPFCTVNLVSLKDIGTGSSEPKGVPKGSEDIKVPEARKSFAREAEKSGPVLPVKRLQLDESPRTHQEVAIKKIEAKEAPKLEDVAQDKAAINLDKLIPKPKVVAKPSSGGSSGPSHESEPAPAEPASPRGGRSASTTDAAPRGSPTGSSDAGAKGATQGSTAGSPDGSSAVNALVGLYSQKVAEAIQREWRLINDKDAAGKKVVVQVQIRKSGEVVSLHVVKASGSAAFDEAAMRAVQRAAPLPAVPEVMMQSNVITLNLNFVPGGVS